MTDAADEAGSTEGVLDRSEESESFDVGKGHLGGDTGEVGLCSS